MFAVLHLLIPKAIWGGDICDNTHLNISKTANLIQLLSRAFYGIFWIVIVIVNGGVIKALFKSRNSLVMSNLPSDVMVERIKRDRQITIVLVGTATVYLLFTFADFAVGITAFLGNLMEGLIVWFVQWFLLVGTYGSNAVTFILCGQVFRERAYALLAQCFQKFRATNAA